MDYTSGNMYILNNGLYELWVEYTSENNCRRIDCVRRRWNILKQMGIVLEVE
jgi:hypothetical protein